MKPLMECDPREAGLRPEALSHLRQSLQGAIDRQHLPGAVALIVRGGRIAFFEAFGRQSPLVDTPMARDSVFRVYSMTKPIVSLAVLQLVEQGRVLLGDPVALHLPMFAKLRVSVERHGVERLEELQRPPTVQDLLRHTAGLTYEFLGNSAVHRRYSAANLASSARNNMEFCQALAEIPLAHQPGTVWEYSRATDVLGALVEAVTGQSLGQALQQTILGPLGMVDTSFVAGPERAHRLAEPFARDPDSGAEVKLIDVINAPRFESGGGGLVSTAVDYARFMQMLAQRGTLDGVRIASRKTIEWMTADHLGSIPAAGDLLLPGHGFGLGLAVRTHAGLAPTPGSVGQYFWTGIAGTSFFIDPAEDLSAMLLTQAPGQRIHYRTLWRHLVYSTLE